jgi:hypothetical protein
MIPEVGLSSLDTWLAEPAVRVAHRRESSASPERLWQAASELRLRDTGLLGRLIRWRIPGVSANSSFQDLFRCPPFNVLEETELGLTSGLVGRIWTLRRDYPQLDGPGEYREWSRPGTAKVLFAHWVEAPANGRCAIRSEVRVESYGVQGRIGLTSVRPLIRAFHQLVATEALAAAVRRAEAG